MSTVIELPKTKEEKLISVDPASGEMVGKVAISTREDVFEAVEKSRTAFSMWRKTAFSVRTEAVMRARQVILSEMDEIAELISREMGKPKTEAVSAEIAPVLDLMQYFASNSKKLLKPKKRGIGLLGWLGRSSKIIHKPVGVVGIISPWNFPLSIPLGEVVMAIMAGNTVVLETI